MAVVGVLLAVSATFPSPFGPSSVGAKLVRSALPADSTQLVVGLADGWDATKLTLYRLQKRKKVWVQIGAATPARIGPTGLSWGLGLMAPEDIASDATELADGKVEGDRTAPAGVFRLGPVFTYDGAWAKHTSMPVIRVGPNDLFVEDPESPLYNSHIRLDHAPATAWEKKEQMQQGDPAHRLKVFVGHNVDPPVGGRGSAIFLHVWRDGGRVPTAGCTAMDFDVLSTMVKWLQADAKPLYIVLPRSIFLDVRQSWELPELHATTTAKTDKTAQLATTDQSDSPTTAGTANSTNAVNSGFAKAFANSSR